MLDEIEANPEIIENSINDDYPQPEIMFPTYVKRTWIPAMHRRSLIDYYPQENIEFNDEDFEKYLPFIDYLISMNLSPRDVEELLRPENREQLAELLRDFFKTYQIIRERQKEEEFEEWVREQNLEFVKQKLLEELSKQEMPTKFSRKYNTPEKFRSGWESRDELPLLDNRDSTDLYESRVYIDENEEPHEETGSGENIHPEIFRELKQQHQLENENKLPAPRGGIFTEGGVVYVPQKDPEQILKNDLGKFLDEFDFGFKRRERLDVKKPGPPFNERITTEAKEKKEPSGAVVKKDPMPRGAPHPDPLHEQQFDVETEFAYIGLKDR